MKPISSLPTFRRYTNVAGVLGAMQRLFRNPKRHVRGPFYNKNPGTGEGNQFNGPCNKHEAVSACAAGAMELFEANSRVATAASRALNKAAKQLSSEGVFGGEWGDNYVGISEEYGLPALRKVINRAVKNVGARA